MLKPTKKSGMNKKPSDAIGAIVFVPEMPGCPSAGA